MHLLKAVGRGAALLLVVVAAVIVFWSETGRTSELRAAVVWNQLDIHVDELRCLSINPRRIVFNKRQYPSERLVSTIGTQLAIPHIYVNADVAECPWGLSLVGVRIDTFAVRYRDEIARYLLSVGVCERMPDGTPNANRCISKNVYVFNHNVAVDALFSIALTGLARKQTDKWEAFQVEGEK